MKLNFNRWFRKLHRWGALICAIPLLLVIVTGLLLQVKKQVAWIQPPTVNGAGDIPAISFEQVLVASRGVPEAGIESWADIDRLDVRPAKGVVKVRSKSSWELQIDLETSKVLASNYRRSDFIESLHDGSWFNDGAKLWVFLPNGLILLGLWFTGAYLWYLPFMSRAKKKKRLAATDSTE